MEIILTHEQADFDALASTLAACLINPDSKAVLPGRINRNAHKFINLYGSELPFVEPRDLLHQPVRSVILVDTQSLVTLKGITKNTKIHVIDHHQQRPDLPEDWTRKIEKVGATTTLLVEIIRDRNIQTSTIQATLLLLGIYEDTGSLTYASTTVRDAKAVVFLLEQGASLRIAAEYLNPALSVNQRALADKMLINAETLTIQGKDILLSQADASEINEEISSVAHKLRDLLDPDALFLMVKTKEGIRLIARSTSDEINVAKIMSLFGGGGHERAASALLVDQELPFELALPNLKEKLIEGIKTNIRPALSVSKIMSKKPLLLSPDTTVDEADRVMQRYGYEGYPVVYEGKVIGLLTRRAIDRARAHRLTLYVSSLMESGNYTLLPDQSIDQVRDLMATTGWGQIPVIDPASQAIIGIVTRTDLLKNLMAGERSKPKTASYERLIRKALSPCRLALLKKIIELAEINSQALYIVGGFVRDLLLQKPSPDFDIVVEGDAIKLAHMLAKDLGGRVVTHRRFGTAKWKIKTERYRLERLLGFADFDGCDLPESLDFISARTEFYDHPTALPTVESSSIKQDLHRRDFTINTLALRLDGSHFGELQDYWGGLSDLEKKRVKVLHSLSFVDDPTRMLRAVRFEQRFGFQIETRTLQLMQEARENLKQVSGDRIRHELDLIFKETDPAKVLKRFMDLNLLGAIYPGLIWSEVWKPAVNRALFEKIEEPWNPVSPNASIPVRTVVAYLIWFSNLTESDAVAIGNRLHFSNDMADAIKSIFKLRSMENDLRSMSISQFTNTLRGIPEFILFALRCTTSDEKVKDRLTAFVTHWRYVESFTTGEILKSLGIAPGPHYARMLSELRDARLDGLIETEEQEQELLDKISQAYR